MGLPDEKSNIKINDAGSEAEELFLSGCAFLSLKDYTSASEHFLKYCKMSPTHPKGWLYLLASITEDFTVLRNLVDEDATRNVGKRKIMCASVYKNFVSTAKKDDYINAKNEFGIDLDPKGEELGVNILVEIIRADRRTLPLQKAARLAILTVENLLSSHPQTAKHYFPYLCKKLNTVHEGVLEINTLAFYPDSPDGIFRADTSADSIEFASEDMAGSERFKAFMLTKGIENIGTSFPFSSLVVEEGVTAIPDKLMCFCTKLETVTLAKSVKRIGKEAFMSCEKLRSVAPLDNIKEIGDGAFFGTSVKRLELPEGVTKLGRAVVGRRENEDCPISEYLIILNSELAAKSPDFNTVGQYRAGCILRENGKMKLVYPVKMVGDKPKAIAHGDKVIFKALSYSSIEGREASYGVLPRIKEIFKRK